MKINITKRFVDERGGRLLAPGIQEIDDKDAERLIAAGKAVSLSAAEEKAEAALTSEQAAKTTADAGSQASEGPSEGSDIPAGFPERDILIAGGLDTVKKLKDETAKDKIEALEGISKAKLTKIGLAIEEL